MSDGVPASLKSSCWSRIVLASLLVLIATVASGQDEGARRAVHAAAWRRHATDRRGWSRRREDTATLAYSGEGTDRARRDVVSGGFIDAFNSSPLAAKGVLAPSRGYAATPLTGVWANYPYLHNGSVPTLHHLLGPVAERPQIFSVLAARHFDREWVGQRLCDTSGHGQLPESALITRFGSDRDWFSVARQGCGNGGHDVWPRIKTDANRRALMEYLKTL